MHRYLPYLTVALLAAAHGCSLVIGDIPPAGSDESDVSSGGQEGTFANGGSSAGGDAGASDSSTGATSGTQGGTGNDGGQAGARPASGGGDGGTGGDAMSTVSGGDGGSGASGGATSSGGSGGCAEECDCDGDDALSEVCAGDDCDDHNDRVFPEQVLYFDVSAGTIGFDYNCDDRSEQEFGDAIDCAGLSLVECDEAEQGFLDSLPTCGNSGPWGTCVAGTLTCMDQEIDRRVMRCR